jgi:hypothetical protein
MTTIIDEDQLEKFTHSAHIAGLIVEELPDMVAEHDADVGVAALIICGLLAGKLIAGGLTREEFMRQMDMAIMAKIAADSTTRTPQ